MRYNDFKGLKVSALGFGTMRLPMDASGAIDYNEGEKMVAEAMNGGITYFDTAYRYHEGESENFCGRVISKYPREISLYARRQTAYMALQYQRRCGKDFCRTACQMQCGLF